MPVGKYRCGEISCIYCIINVPQKQHIMFRKNKIGLEGICCMAKAFM